MLNKLVFDIFILPALRVLDSFIPKRNDFWAFPVHHIKSELFIENARAIFEEVKSDKNIRKIIFLREKTYSFSISDYNNTRIVELKSLKGLLTLARCKIIFVSHSIGMDYSLRWKGNQFNVIKLSLKKHFIINLWHGKSIKKLFSLSNPLVRKRVTRVKYRVKECKYYKGLITTSKIDSYSMSSMFYPIKYENVWITGYPNNDFLIEEIENLPYYITNQINYVRKLKKGKKLIFYAPTYRQVVAVKNAEYYQFSQNEINNFKKILIKHKAIFGFRFHYFRNSKEFFNLEEFVDNELIFDFGHDNIPEITPIIRESDLVISDYSSVFIDSIFVNKPVLGFVYDLDNFIKYQDGFLYDFEIVFPGPADIKFNELLKHIDDELSNPKQVKSDRYKIVQKFFFEYRDALNSKRVVNKIKEILG